MIWLSEIKYAKAWEVTHLEKYTKAQLSTSEKKQDGTYENSKWFVNFVGKCSELAKTLQNGDTVTINKAKLTNLYNKEHKKSYLNFVVFDFEITQSKAKKEDDFSDFEQVDEDPFLPF